MVSTSARAGSSAKASPEAVGIGVDDQRRWIARQIAAAY